MTTEAAPITEAGATAGPAFPQAPAPLSPAHVKALLAEEPDNADAWTSLGTLFNQGDNRNAAVRHHRRALTIRPSFGTAWSNLGFTLTQMGRHAEAIACHHRAGALAPDSLPHAFNLSAGL